MHGEITNMHPSAIKITTKACKLQFVVVILRYRRTTTGQMEGSDEPASTVQRVGN
jgi:hypothetical protein